ncbi:MAG: hypothetical protein RJA49_374 [Actinomycetota bacterium]
MPGVGARTAAVTPARMRVTGLARGVAAFVATWLGGMTMAFLTGATGVVIALAVGVVAGIAGALAGPIALRRAVVHEVHTATVVTAGDDLVWTVLADVPHAVHAVLTVEGEEVARGWLEEGFTSLAGRAPQRGVHRSVTVTWSTAGRLGMLWWRRRATCAIAPLYSGPAPAAAPARAVRAPDDLAGAVAAGTRAGHDDVDGVRQWRDGDEVTAVHWPSTMRLGEFVVREHHRDQDERWIVTAHAGTADPDDEAARVRRAIDDCLSRGAGAAVRIDDGPPTDIDDQADGVRWCAEFEPVDRRDTAHVSLWRRDLFTRPNPEPDTTLLPVARWAVAAGALVPMAMLLQPLGYGPVQIGVVILAVAMGAFVSTRHRPVPQWLRQIAGAAAGLVVLFVLVDVTAIDSPMAAMRYLMPQLLVTLCVLQGFECADRRGARVSLACSALLATYAAGVRVDGALGGYMLAAGIGLALAAQAVTRPDRKGASRNVVWRSAAVLVSVAAVIAILVVVPVPKGPAQLNLPSWLAERRTAQAGDQLARPDGSPLLGGALQGNGARSGSGAGGYPGFSTMMNTSMRGDLGDDVVLRVRAAAPDFWRGQTFSRFDGTTWYIERPQGSEGSPGNDHEIPPGEGDLMYFGEPEYTQTYYVEVDMPNILFAATQAQRVLLDATVWHRPDGALRSDVVLPAGSAYTVQSHRTDVTPDGLRAEGSSWQTPTATALQLPDSTTARTRALAAQLAAGSPSTYDTVERIEAWLHDHVTYDLDAPVPPAGKDAVDDFLFESRRGFCEQIASATAVMLRSLGVPARIATGYVPSERDEVAGVWISRARDAHAWVEVWFPGYGWVPFDPTASVPFSGQSSIDSIGVQLVRALAVVVSDHLPTLITLIVGIVLLMAAARAIRAAWRRHRRGRWGVLQDRFVAAAVARGAAPTAPNVEMAAAFADERATGVAHALDECAFSPAWTDDPVAFRRVTGEVDLLLAGLGGVRGRGDRRAGGLGHGRLGGSDDGGSAGDDGDASG